MRSKFVSFLATIAGIIVLLACVIGFNETQANMPDYAVVYVDDIEKIYLALPCMDEWKHRKSDHFSLVRRATAGEARKMHYEMDDQCREAGGFIDDDWPLAALLLVRLGILPPAAHWWDQPYRTEDGVVLPRG